MKKIAILVASVLVLGGFNSKAFAAEANAQAAQTTQTTTAAVSLKDQAGITPDSLLYTIDKAVDNLRILLAASDEKKTEVIADVAQERLGESEVMTDAGKVELAEKALQEYNDKITEAADKLQQVVATTQDTEDEKVQAKVDDLEKVFQKVQDKSLEVLNVLQDKAGKDEAEAVKKVEEEQTAHKEAVAAFVKERHEFNAVKKELNMAKAALKKAQGSGDEKAIADANAKLESANTAYTAAKTELQTAFQAKKALEGKKKDQVKPVSTDAAATVDQNNKAVDAAVKTDQNSNTSDSTKINSDKSSKDKSAKVEKEDDDKKDKEKNDKEKSAPGKSGEEHGKSEQANGKNK